MPCRWLAAEPASGLFALAGAHRLCAYAQAGALSSRPQFPPWRWRRPRRRVPRGSVPARARAKSRGAGDERERGAACPNGAAAHGPADSGRTRGGTGKCGDGLGSQRHARSGARKAAMGPQWLSCCWGRSQHRRAEDLVAMPSHDLARRRDWRQRAGAIGCGASPAAYFPQARRRSASGRGGALRRAADGEDSLLQGHCRAARQLLCVCGACR
eukprot:Amastigsp_a513524_13.p2 type:complete len:213 gc:universal Amastigsp_a513524_13:1301-663(-)